MEILRDYDLTKLNTFGVPARAKFFVEVAKELDFKGLFDTPEFKNNEKFFLGGGSNTLFTRNFDGIVILNKLKGIGIVEENDEHAILRAMSGEIWHDLVEFAVARGLWGVENLSLIPGTVGAAPMQNIGAYGAELKNVLFSVEAFNIETGEKKIFSKEECELGYRDSVFKNSLKGKYFITAVTLKLSKKENKNLNYKILVDHLVKNNIQVREPKDISDAVAEIRRSKLPDPKVIGNAGSFFKNVFVPKEKLEELLQTYPDMPYFEEGGVMKIPAGWLVEMCGWKGKSLGKVGVHDRQALVLVNHGGAEGAEVQNLAEKIINDVYEKFRLKLTPEVNLL
jgi:UDP-N-acetylmuramate dehydrogenase